MALVGLVLLAGCSSHSRTQIAATGGATTTTRELATTTSTSTTVPPPITTTTARPATTTTARPATTTTTRPAVAPGQASVTVINDYSAAVVLSMNGVKITVAAGKRAGPLGVTPEASGNDVVNAARADNPSCGQGGAGDFFQDRGAHEVHFASAAAHGCSNGEQQFDMWIDPGHKTP